MSGTSAKGTGLSGVSTSSYGVYGSSKSGVGVKAVSSSSSAIFASSSAPSYPTVNVQNTGSGTAIAAHASNGTGLDISVQNGAALHATSANGDGIDASVANGDGLRAVTLNGDGLVGMSSNGTGVSATGQTFGLIAQTTATGTSYPIGALAPNGDFVAYIDDTGKIYSAGGYYSVAKTVAGDVRTFGATATAPTVEDVGTSALRSGTARVSLDPTFARTIDGTTPYHVFLTPAGDTRGLFVAERDRSGFIVREAQGGRGSLGFDYRIVATTAGHARERLQLVDRESEPHAPRFDAQALRGAPVH